MASTSQASVRARQVSAHARSSTPLAALFLAVWLSACGGGGSGGEAAAPSPSPSAGGVTPAPAPAASTPSPSSAPPEPPAYAHASLSRAWLQAASLPRPVELKGRDDFWVGQFSGQTPSDGTQASVPCQFSLRIDGLATLSTADDTLTHQIALATEGSGKALQTEFRAKGPARDPSGFELRSPGVDNQADLSITAQRITNEFQRPAHRVTAQLGERRCVSALLPLQIATRQRLLSCPPGPTLDTQHFGCIQGYYDGYIVSAYDSWRNGLDLTGRNCVLNIDHSGISVTVDGWRSGSVVNFAELARPGVQKREFVMLTIDGDPYLNLSYTDDLSSYIGTVRPGADGSAVLDWTHTRRTTQGQVVSMRCRAPVY